MANGMKRVVFNQIIDNQPQVDKIVDFLDMVVRNPKRKWRLIIEEIKPVVLDDPVSISSPSSLTP